MSRVKALERLLTATAPLGVLGTRPYTLAHAPRHTLPSDRARPGSRTPLGRERITARVAIAHPGDLLDHHYPTARGRMQ